MTKFNISVITFPAGQAPAWFISRDLAAATKLADEQDGLLIKEETDLLALTGPQAVALYNETAKVISPSLAPVARFADKKAAAKRIWANVKDLFEKADVALAKALVEKAHRPAEVQKTKPAVILGDHVDPALIPAPKEIKGKVVKPAKPARRSTGINLAPKARVYACREGSKQAILVDLLSRVQGATMGELLKGLSGGEKPWQEVTVKSGLNWDMNKVKGYGIRTTKRMEFDCYHLVLPKGMSAPLPHTPRKTKKEG